MTILQYKHWHDVEVIHNWGWSHFLPKEFASPDTGALVIESRLLDLLQALRYFLGQPLIITSGYRTPEYNAVVSKTGTSGPHVKGVAVDLTCPGECVFKLVQVAFGLGFTGIGLRQHGTLRRRFVHLDIMQEPPRPNLWTYDN